MRLTDEAVVFIWILVTSVVFIAFLIWNSGQKKLAQRRLKIEEQNALLDRIGAGGSLGEFLQSEQGQRLLERLSEPDRQPERPRSIRWSIVTLLTFGAILPLVGIALIPTVYRDDDMAIPIGILIGVGVGCLVAAAIQHYVGKRFGLFESRAEGNGRSEAGAR